MDINNLITELQQLSPELSSSYCMVNRSANTIDSVQNMGYDKFSDYSKISMLLKFYKYYPNTELEKKENGEKVNYSIQALKNNTIFLQTPTAFDDVYDSDININPYKYAHLRLIEYCKRCDIEVSE